METIARPGMNSTDAQAHLVYAFDAAPSFLAILKGPDFVFEAVNEAFLDLVGNRDVIGRPLFEALPELRAQGFQDIVSEVLNSGKSYVGRGVPIRLQRTKAGPTDARIVDFSFLPLPEDGHRVGIIAHGHDVTEAANARMALEKARDRIERLHGGMTRLSLAAKRVDVAHAAIDGAKAAFPESVGVIIATRSQGEQEQLEILAVSELPGQVFEKWRQFPLSANAPVAEAVRNATEIVLESPADWASRYPELVPLLIETGHRAQIVMPMTVAGVCTGCIGIAFDTPRQFQPEEIQLATALAQHSAAALERARLYDIGEDARERAENASRYKSEFLANISHELRTPLNAIAGYADLIELGIHGPVTDAQKIALGRIQASQKHVNALIDSVLELSRIEAGATHYNIEPLVLGELVSQCESLALPMMNSRGLVYERQGEMMGVVILADALKVRQILLNLFTNATKYTLSGGTITLAAETSIDSVSLNVIDTGIGIASDELELIFDPFVRAHGADGAPGVGLGLAISRNLARGMGGDITVESEVSRGSKFTLTVPGSQG